MKEKRKTRTGKVISDKMDKTVVVLVESLRRHPLYKKVVRHTSNSKPMMRLMPVRLVM